MHYFVAHESDLGIIKKVNQDSMSVLIADTEDGEVLLAVLCDGMGGLSLGEVASASVIETFRHWFYNDFRKIQRESKFEKVLEKSWKNLLFYENEKIRSYGKEKKLVLGTTFTAILFLKKSYYVMHVGDCRVYKIHRLLRQITTDHTLLAEEIRKGNISWFKSRKDSRKNILLQCIGVKKHIEPDFMTGKIDFGATYLLCTDGFRNKISKKEIFIWCRPGNNFSVEDMKKNIHKLITINKRRKEIDNISAILIRPMEGKNAGDR